ncbi:MAG: hypothetical protein ACTJGW_03285 [Vibrio casei]|uniref:hypothetical protein n=1 Tax=Vibrio casei TaxID=673372 RepID=UPI0018662A64|nr:hypothetical protein [Vibrio casei]
MSNGNLNAATDKAIFDAMNQSRVTKGDISELFFQRGVIVSSSTDKETLAKEFSSFFHSHADYDRLASILGVNNRKERLTTFGVETSLKAVDVENSVKKIKDKLNEEGASVKHVVLKDGQKIELRVTYQVLNLSKNDFQQVSVRDAVISIEDTDDGLNIRYPQNSKVQEFSDIIIDVLESKDKDLDRMEINLTSLEEPESRSKFFGLLIEKMEGYTLKDVTDAFVFNPNSSSDTENEREVHIKSASLKGRGVNLSSELTNLHTKGFYTWKVIWKAVKTNSESSDLYVFEAQFTNAEECKDFSYMVKGSHKRKDKGTVGEADGHTINRTNTTDLLQPDWTLH